MTETWMHWDPIPGLAKKYDIDAILDTFDDLTIILSEYNSENKVRIVIDGTSRAYRQSDETYRCNLISQLDKKYGGDFYGNRTFFRVTDSEYLQWLSEQSSIISDHYGVQHYSILGINWVLDIAIPFEPKVEFIEGPQGKDEKIPYHARWAPSRQ